MSVVVNPISRLLILDSKVSSFPTDLKALFSVLWLGTVSGNQLVDVIGGNNITITNKDFSTSYIPGTSSSTLALPNTAALKTDDNFDTLWYSDAGAVNNVTIPFLQLADYSRTLVKYSNSSPYNIEWIGVLDDAANPSADQLNRLHNLFQLHYWWTGAFNLYGVMKTNRALEGQGYKGWITKVNTSYPANTLTTLVKSSLNKTALHIIKTGEGAWYELDALWPFMLNDNSLVTTIGCISMVRPALTAPTFPVAPTYTTSGFEGNATTQYCNTQFNASVNGIKYTLSSASRFMLKYKAGAGANGNDGHPSFTASNNMQNGNTAANRINVAANCVTANFGGTGYRAIDRNASAIAAFVDAVKTTGTVAPGASLTNENFSILRNSFGYGDAGIAFYGLGAHLTDAQHGVIRVALAAHKTRLGL